jgi:hypothetical protein
MMWLQLHICLSVVVTFKHILIVVVASSFPPPSPPPLCWCVVVCLLLARCFVLGWSPCGLCFASPLVTKPLDQPQPHTSWDSFGIAGSATMSFVDVFIVTHPCHIGSLCKPEAARFAKTWHVAFRHIHRCHEKVRNSINCIVLY